MKVTDINTLLEEPQATFGKEYTYADYITWEFEEMVELIRGQIFRMSPAPGTSHQKVVGNLFKDIAVYLHKRKCQVFIAPYDVVLPVKNKKRETATTVVQPDICVICDLDIIEERGCFGVPDLIIEALSPHTSKKDLKNKYDVYEEAGVKEYWIVMPHDQLLEIFFLEEGHYKRKGMYVFEDHVSPTMFPDLEIQLADVFIEKNKY
jgi:Uma2 family endonuclease